MKRTAWALVVGLVCLAGAVGAQTRQTTKLSHKVTDALRIWPDGRRQVGRRNPKTGKIVWMPPMPDEEKKYRAWKLTHPALKHIDRVGGTYVPKN